LDKAEDRGPRAERRPKGEFRMRVVRKCRCGVLYQAWLIVEQDRRCPGCRTASSASWPYHQIEFLKEGVMA
jgi:hypothetical protein